MKSINMKELLRLLALFLIFVTCVLCKGQNKTEVPKDTIKSETKEVITPQGFPYGPYSETYSGPNSITRTIIQDRKGNIWLASWQGVFRYDGKFFTNMTSEVSSARFFSALEDSKGNLWFGSIGSGVYRYDGKSFQNFTTDDGLLNNEIVCIYEDKNGNIWFGANGGASLYDGKSYRNYTINGNSMMEDNKGETISNIRPMNEVNSIVEDESGKFWFGTRGQTFIYDGKTFTSITNYNQPFYNVRTIIEGKKLDIWLGGTNGLWRYDGSTFRNINKDFVGYIYEDKKGNIWTSSQTAQGWVLSRYDENSLSNKEPIVTEIKSDYESNKRMIFGILEDFDGNILFGSLDGMYRYDGNTISDFKK